MPPRFTLYNLIGCPLCVRVKRHMDRLGLEYQQIQVLPFHGMRKAVKRLSGQTGVPVLLDGDRVIVDSQIICDYLSTNYGRAESRARAAAADSQPV